MKRLILIWIVFISVKSSAQLPSEKPFEELVSPAAKQKLTSGKQENFSHATLPSKAPLPNQASISKGKTSSSIKGKVQQRKLPSAIEIDWEIKQASTRKK